jgi:hypothetical protein
VTLSPLVNTILGPSGGVSVEGPSNVVPLPWRLAADGSPAVEGCWSGSCDLAQLETARRTAQPEEPGEPGRLGAHDADVLFAARVSTLGEVPLDELQKDLSVPEG